MIRLGLHNISQTKPPVLEFKDDQWKLWTAYNQDLTLGTYIILHKSGKMEQATIHPDNTISTVFL